MPRANQDLAGDTRVPRLITGHAHNDGGNSFPAYIDNSVDGEVFLRIPPNWQGLAEFNIWLLAGGTAQIDLDIVIDIATCDELYHIHEQVVNNHMVNVVADTYKCVDLMTIFAVVLANLQSDDMVWISIDSDYTEFGIRFVMAEALEL